MDIPEWIRSLAMWWRQSAGLGDQWPEESRTTRVSGPCTVDTCDCDPRITMQALRMAASTGPSDDTVARTRTSTRRGITIYQLPPEVVDYIIDFLHEDKHALKACVLTCRAWLPSARHHLFASLLIKERRLAQFLAFVEATPHMALHVRSLALVGEQPQFPDRSKRPALTNVFLDRLFKLLPSLQHLHILSMLLKPYVSQKSPLSPSRAALPPPPSPKHRLQSLTMLYAGSHLDHTFTDFVNFLHSFASIEDLHIELTRLHRSVESASFLPPSRWSFPPHLRMRSVHVNDIASLTNLYLQMLQSIPLDALQSIGVRSRHRWDVDLFGAILRDRGPWLRHLDLDLSGIGHDPAVRSLPQTLCLQSCAHLKTFTLRIAPNPFNSAFLPWSEICAILVSLSHAPLRSLTVHLSTQLDLLNSPIDWVLFQRTVDGLRHLKVLTLVESGMSNISISEAQRVCAEIQRRIPIRSDRYEIRVLPATMGFQFPQSVFP